MGVGYMVRVQWKRSDMFAAPTSSRPSPRGPRPCLPSTRYSLVWRLK